MLRYAVSDISLPR